MLVLGRKIGERILLPDCGLEVTVIDVKGDRVRLGFEGPKEQRVHRAEIHEALTQKVPLSAARS